MEQETKKYPEILIITGHSGAGKSTVLSACEDYGFFCIDNLPFELLAPFFYGITHFQKHQKIALGIDVRSGLNLDLFAQELLRWQNMCGQRMRIIFLTAQQETLIRRFQETRRKHPLGDNKTLLEAMHQEHLILKPLKSIATETIETDNLTIAQLRLLVRNSNITDKQQKIIVTLTSFGFKHGTPSDCNFLYDLRSLPNPYFVPNLKELDGRSERIQEYLFAQPSVQEYWKKLEDFFIFSLERSYQEGRFFIHVGFGCTGGKHRSVAFVERCSRLNLEHVQFFIHHKDIMVTDAQQQRGI